MKKTIVLLSLLIIASTNIYAATFCVRNSSELQSALSNAATNGQSDLIKMTGGVYVSENIGFNYYGLNDFDLEISGGWSQLFGNPCGQQLSVEPFATIIDGFNNYRGILIQPSQSSDVNINSIYFTNGFTENARGGAITAITTEANMGHITLKHNAFFNNTAKFGGAVTLSANKITLINNSFRSNHSTNGSTIELVSNATTGVYFINNTVLQNTTDNKFIDVAAGLYIAVSGSSQALIANNVFNSNDVNQFRLIGDGFKYVRNNNIVGTVSGVTADSESNNFSTPSNFENSANAEYYIPSLNSPLVNTGIKPPDTVPFPIPFIWDWQVPARDIRNQTRIQGGRIDVGAFESAPEIPIFMNGFEQITP